MDRKRQGRESESAAQIDRFKETPRQIGCDEDEAAFDKKLKVVARQQCPNSASVSKPAISARNRAPTT